MESRDPLPLPQRPAARDDRAAPARAGLAKFPASLHMTLPPELADEAFEKGWGEPHPYSGTPLIYGPRDEHELEVVWRLLQASYEFARG